MELSLRTVHDRPANLRRSTGFFSDFERSIDDLFGRFLEGSVMPIGVAGVEGTFSPRMDIEETKSALTVTVELPGMDQKEIDVSVHDGVLTVSGEKKVGKEENGTDYHYIERSYGCFSRSFSLPDTVETGKIGAAYKDGVLTVTLPKTAKAVEQSHKIPITA
jgi:HSP20 family protein